MPDLRQDLQAALGDAYTIERELGGGGMSRVFLASETALGRRVVVKVLPEELSGSVSIARFRREISVAARLQHPHIVPLIAAGEVKGLPYYTMPFVDGDSLRARLTHGELPVAEMVSILRDVAKALEYAHGQGVVHRDIKPDNVLLVGRSAVITDFGVAKALTEATTEGQLTSVGVALGTPAYMAPEQAAADPATDRRADLYAVGAMAYEMLAGHAPFAGRSAQAVLAAHATEAPTSIGSLRSATPPVLAALVMRCLEKRPGDRPQSAQELLQVLDQVVTTSGTPVGAGAGVPPVPRAPSGTSPSGGSRRYRVAVMAAATALVVLGAGAWWRARATDPDVNRIRAIAVLPLDNISKDTAFDYLEDGITDHVRDALNANPDVTVKARGSSVKMKGHAAREIGKTLGVDAVLQGTVSRVGSRLKVTTELVRTSNETQLWSKTFDGQSTELVGVQDGIMQGVSAYLHLAGRAGSTAGAGARGTSDAEAYDLFLRGRHARDRFDLRGAQTLFKAAIQRDPRFARAMGLLAMTYADLPILGSGSTDSALVFARRYADQALGIDSSVAEAYIAKSYIQSSDYLQFPAALKTLEKALAFDSSNVDLLWNYAFGLAQVGRPQEGIVIARRARAKDPLRVIGLLGKMLIMVHQYDSAYVETKAIIDLDPTHVLAYRELGVLYELTNKPDSGLAAFETAYRLAPRDFGTGANLVLGYAMAGRMKDAERQRALVEAGGGGNSPNYNHVVENIAFGNIDAAMTALERALANGDPVFGTMSIPCDPIFDPLKKSPRFAALMVRMGTTACRTVGP